MTNLPYLFAAYTAVWVGVFLYLRRLARLERDLEDEVRALRRSLQR